MWLCIYRSNHFLFHARSTREWTPAPCSTCAAGVDSSLSAGNALITMYARCGVAEAANALFLTMPCVDSMSWSAMIAALGQHGHGVQAFRTFQADAEGMHIT